MFTDIRTIAPHCFLLYNWYAHNFTTFYGSLVRDPKYLLLPGALYNIASTHLIIRSHKVSKDEDHCFWVVQLLWHLAGISPALQPNHLPKFHSDIIILNTWYHGLKTWWDLTIRHLIQHWNGPLKSVTTPWTCLSQIYLMNLNFICP